MINYFRECASGRTPQLMALKYDVQPQDSLEVQTGSILQRASDQKPQSMASK